MLRYSLQHRLLHSRSTDHPELASMDWSSSSGWHQHSAYWQGPGWGESQAGSSQGGSWHGASCKAEDDVGGDWQHGNTPVLNLNSGQFEFVVALIFGFVGDPKEPKGSHMGQPKLYFWVPSFCPITSSVIGQKDVDPKPQPFLCPGVPSFGPLWRHLE